MAPPCAVDYAPHSSHYAEPSPYGALKPKAVDSPPKSPTSVRCETLASDKKMKKSQGVRFASKKKVYLIKHIEDYNEKDIRNLWYHDEEYQEMKNDFKFTIFMMDHGRHASVENAEMTTRGLEYKTQKGASDRWDAKQRAYDAVLNEQERQWVKGVDNFDRIAELYQTVSVRCHAKAVVAAFKDETAIQEYIMEEDKTESKSPDRQMVKKTREARGVQRRRSFKRLELLKEVRKTNPVQEPEPKLNICFSRAA